MATDEGLIFTWGATEALVTQYTDTIDATDSARLEPIGDDRNYIMLMIDIRYDW